MVGFWHRPTGGPTQRESVQRRQGEPHKNQGWKHHLKFLEVGSWFPVSWPRDLVAGTNQGNGHRNGLFSFLAS